jgi:galactitol PTS system EIIB component
MAGRFKILLLCGTGIATSTAVKAKIEQALRAKNIPLNTVDIRQGKVADVLHGNVDATLIVATAQVPGSVKVPVINGVPLLTGIGAQAVLDQVLAAVQKGGT